MNTRSRSALNKLRRSYPYARSLETFSKTPALTIKAHLLKFQNCGEMTIAEVLALHEKIRDVSEEFYGKPKKKGNS